MTAHITMGTSTGRADLTAGPIFSPGYVCWVTEDRDHGDPITGCLNWLQVMLDVMFAGEGARARDTCAAQAVGPVS